MQHRSRRFAATAAAVLTGVSLLALTSPQLQAQYKLTVNRERLLNAQNEPQNWLMMNGDYGSQRYS
jgi:alcohol dehydrogenase (cytochrome c)